MKKLLIFTSLLFLFLFSNAQKQETVLFGYTSTVENEFYDVIEYCEILKVKVIDYCESESLIFVDLNNQYTEPIGLFLELEQVFSGLCWYKSEKNDIYLREKCRLNKELMENEKLKKERK
jgi:hypothetical protein